MGACLELSLSLGLSVSNGGSVALWHCPEFLMVFCTVYERFTNCCGLLSFLSYCPHILHPNLHENRKERDACDCCICIVILSVCMRKGGPERRCETGKERH